MTTIRITGDIRPMLKDFKKLAQKDVPRATRGAVDTLGRAIYNDATARAARDLGVPNRVIRGAARSRAARGRRRARAAFFRPSNAKPYALIRAYLRPISFGELGSSLVTGTGRLRKRIAGAVERSTAGGREILSKPFAATMPSGRSGLFVRVAPRGPRTKRQRAQRLPIAEVRIPVDPTLPRAFEARIRRADSREWAEHFGRQYRRIVGK